MGVDLSCTNCGNNMGKCTENPKEAYCDECDEKLDNPRGYECDGDED